MALPTWKKPHRGARLRKRPGKRPALRWNGRWLMHLALAAVVVGAGFGVVRLAESLGDLTVERVLFAGDLHRVQRERLVERVQPHLARGFLGLDLEAIQRDVQREPWVFRADVERLWPRQLKVTVTGQVPIAAWGHGGYLNHRGEIFKPSTPAVEQNLPRLDGPEGDAAQIMRHYQLLSGALSDTPLRLQRLQLSERGSWSGALADGVTLELGSGDPLANLRRFLRVYHQGLQTQFSRVAGIDTRYTNGIAVAWRQQG